MSLPYIPGWWDTISQNAQRFAQQLPQSIEPEGVANKRFQQLIQQNPTIMQDFANMDPAMRESMAQAMGMKAAPQSLMNLPVGPQLQARQEEQAFAEGLTPEQRTAYQFTKRGLKTPEEQDYQKQLQTLNLKKLTADVGLQEILDGERKRAIEKLNKLRTDNPNIDVRGLVNRVVSNTMRPDDVGQLQILQADMGDALKTIFDMSMLKQRTGADMMLRRGAQEDDMWRIAMGAVESARKEYNDAMKAQAQFFATNKIAQVNIEGALKANPELRPIFDEINSRLRDAKSRFEAYYPVTKTYMKKMGIELPDLGGGMEAPPSPSAPGTETPQQRRERLKRAAGGM